MTIKQGDQLWVPVTVAGVIGEDGYRFWTDDTWFRDGDQLPLNPALPAISAWLQERGRAELLRRVLYAAQDHPVLDDTDESKAIWTLFEALEDMG